MRLFDIPTFIPNSFEMNKLAIKIRNVKCFLFEHRRFQTSFKCNRNQFSFLFLSAVFDLDTLNDFFLALTSLLDSSYSLESRVRSNDVMICGTHGRSLATLMVMTYRSAYNHLLFLCSARTCADQNFENVMLKGDSYLRSNQLLVKK